MQARSDDSRAESCSEVTTGWVAPCRAWKASVDNTFPGPTSNRTGDDSMESIVLMPSAKRTVSRACRAQYWIEVASDSLIHVPVTHETYGSVGGESRICLRCSRKGSTMGSTIAE
jgi:hypothetical protein